MNKDTQKHYRDIRRILIQILILNLIVALVKIIYGFFIHCVSMTADGFHSLSDSASNIIGLIGVNIASRPIDKDHPYGHKKYETFFSLLIGLFIFIICFSLFKEGIERFYKPVIPKIDIRSFLVMIVTTLINIGAMNYEYKKGKALSSDILISDSMHTKADIFTSLSVIIALVVIKLGFPIFDPIATLIITFFIAQTGYNIVKQSHGILCDRVAILDTKKIEDIVLSVKGVETCHKIRTRGRTDDIHLDLHVQVKADMHIEQAHKISYMIEEAIKKSIAGVTDVVIHMEPKEKV